MIMSTESFNRTSGKIETPIVNEGVLKHVSSIKPKRTCVNALNQRLYNSQKKDKLRNRSIIFTIFFTVGIIGFIVG